VDSPEVRPKMKKSMQQEAGFLNILTSVPNSNDTSNLELISTEKRVYPEPQQIGSEKKLMEVDEFEINSKKIDKSKFKNLKK
jgi:hypothetical protein